MVEKAPDAVPISAGSTTLVAALVRAGIVSPSPAPMMVMGATRAR